MLAGHARGRWSALISIGLLLCFAAPALAETSAISGSVKDAVTHAPLEGIEACAFSTSTMSIEEEESPGNFGCATTGSTGSYTISGLNAGGYNLIFGAPPKSGLNYVTQFYAGKYSFTEASTVTLTAGATTANINAELEPGAEISGTVTEAATGAPLEGILVCAVDQISGGPSGSEIPACATTAAGGKYTLIGLRGGSYEVVFFGGEKFATQAYNDKSTPAEAEPVTVSEGGLTANINAALAPASSAPAGPAPGSTIGPGLTPSEGLLPKGLGVKPGLSLESRQVLLQNDDVAVVKLKCIGTTRCRSRLALTTLHSARDGKRGGAHTVIISRTLSVSIAPGASAEVRLSLNLVGRDLLKAGRDLLAAHLDFTGDKQPALVAQAKSVELETKAKRRG